MSAALLLASACSSRPGFVHVEDGRFIRNGEPYGFVGTNFWYGPILASDGRGGDYDRLVRELDTLKALGLENLRVMVGADGPDGDPFRVEPALQTAPGVYNDTLLLGLDRFMAELGKRGMQAVLYLNNSWEWSGGYGRYIEWTTGERALLPLVDGYKPYTVQMQKFQTNKAAQELFFNHIRAIVGRTNSVTGKPYSEDPAIFSWQISNEPRCFSDDPEIRAGFIGWLSESARLIKELDPNHMVSTGSEGLVGCEIDPELLEQVHSIGDIDYMTIHIWPYNWRWVQADRLTEDLDKVFAMTDEYIGLNREVALRHGMPVVVEEFGYPRDGFSEQREAATTGRDRFYEHIIALVSDGTLDGANFWGWSGFAEPEHSEWKPGDDYTADPPHEPQGLYGVYVTDSSTVEIIKQF